jgi:hypothetical protein
MRRLLTVLLCLPAAPARADDAALQPAVEAARRREARLKTVVVEWKITAFVPKGGRMEADPVGLALPRADVTVESTHRLVIDGDRYRSDHNDPGVRMMVPVALDGSLASDGVRVYYRSYHQGRDKPAQLVVEASRGRDFGPYAGRPLALWCRGTGLAPYGGREHELAASAPAEIDGGEMLEVRYPPTRITGTTYWLDRRRDYLVRRVRAESGGTVEVTDVEYAERPGVGWVPTGWTVVKTRDGGRLVQRTRAEVTTLRVGEAVPPETFRLDPLPGESVHDNDAHKSYQARADGTLEEVDESGLGRPSGDAPGRLLPAWPGRSLVRYGLLPGLFVGVLAAVVLRRRRPPHTPSQ